LNQPTSLVAEDPDDGRKVTILDISDEIRPYALSSVRVVKGTLATGERWIGGLFIPSNAEPGKKYPLVIQTHGFDPDIFAPQGIGPTANAAQLLSEHGIAVLQLEDTFVVMVKDRTKELPTAMATYESVVDSLDDSGLIDRTRVGLEGWSRTGQHVYYALQHSKVDFAAAYVSDAQTGGYFEKVAVQNVDEGYQNEGERLFGAPPQGEGLLKWAERSPGFNMDKIHVPLRIEACNSRTVLFVWEAYARLLELHKPVELFVYPFGEHALVQPSYRLATAGGVFDWFRFWLKGEEDNDSRKAEQYARWRQLRQFKENR
jgi:dipeptidyl aminopeptidase/acylaminoacyl peptidase